MPKSQWRVTDIDIGNRHRKKMGDLASLMKSIQDIGLLHPIVIRPDGQLVAGRRRLEAFRKLSEANGKYKTIPVTVIDIEEIVRAEHDENVCRENFTPSEAVAIARVIEEAERPGGDQRRLANLKRGTKSPERKNLPLGDEGRAKDKAAAVAGMSRPTLEKAEAVVDAAKDDPETYGPVQEEMDRTGKVDPAYRKVKGGETPKKKQPTDKRGSHKDWLKFQDLAKDLNKTVGEMKELLVDAPHAMSVRDTCEGIIKKLTQVIRKNSRG